VSDRWGKLSEAARALRAAERPIRVLRCVAWPERVRGEFLAAGGRELPRVSYQPIDPASTLAAVRDARARITGGGHPEAWLRRVADDLEIAAHMLAAVGTREFSARSAELYGTPRGLLQDGESRPLDLARQLDEVFTGLDHEDLGEEAPACHLAALLAGHLEQAVRRHLGDSGPRVELVDDLSANVVAGPRRVRVRRTASFSDTDFGQLVNHEILVHVATSLNGRAQTELPILGGGHPGTTRTQEGLAVFAEFITGSLAPDRFHRLADRVLAIQMALDGADFLEVYRYFLERTHGSEQAFENTRRVFRGGLLQGGAPFTKDIVYLDGLLRVHNFLRSAVLADRPDCIDLLFCGKLDLEDVPALCELAAVGLLRRPRFSPPWIKDKRYLVAYLAYSGFLNRIALPAVQAHYDQTLSDSPRVRWQQ
jgi:uncharacterized protein (TIGR02421 family)